jgi:hypothetical protein
MNLQAFHGITLKTTGSLLSRFHPLQEASPKQVRHTAGSPNAMDIARHWTWTGLTPCAVADMKTLVNPLG